MEEIWLDEQQEQRKSLPTWFNSHTAFVCTTDTLCVCVYVCVVCVCKCVCDFCVSHSIAHVHKMYKEAGSKHYQMVIACSTCLIN